MRQRSLLKELHDADADLARIVEALEEMTVLFNAFDTKRDTLGADRQLAERSALSDETRIASLRVAHHQHVVRDAEIIAVLVTAHHLLGLVIDVDNGRLRKCAAYARADSPHGLDERRNIERADGRRRQERRKQKVVAV